MIPFNTYRYVLLCAFIASAAPFQPMSMLIIRYFFGQTSRGASQDTDKHLQCPSDKKSMLKGQSR